MTSRVGVETAADLEPLERGVRIALARGAADRTQRPHVLALYRRELEIEHELSVGLDPAPLVAHDHTVGAFDPDPQGIERALDLGNPLANARDAAPDPPHRNAALEERHHGADADEIAKTKRGLTSVARRSGNQLGSLPVAQASGRDGEDPRHVDERVVLQPTAMCHTGGVPRRGLPRRCGPPRTRRTWHGRRHRGRDQLQGHGARRGGPGARRGALPRARGRVSEPTHIELTLAPDGAGFSAHAHVTGRAELAASAQAPELALAADRALERLGRALRRVHDKRTFARRREAMQQNPKRPRR